MRKSKVTSVAIFAMLAVAAAMNAAPGTATNGRGLNIRRVALPGDGRGDYLLADQSSNRLFVTHTKVVHVLRLDTLAPIAELGGLSAAHGVAVDSSGRAYVTDGKSDSIVVFDPTNGRRLGQIAVGKGPDSIVSDPTSSKIFAFSGESEDVSVIDPTKVAIAATIKLPSAPEFSQADGAGHVYVNLEGSNAVAVIDSNKLRLDHLIPLAGCEGPAPLAIDKIDRRLFIGCGNNMMVVVNADSGKTIASLPVGTDPDGIVYDAKKKRVIVGNRNGKWTIIRQVNADKYAVERTLKIDEYAKTLALDPNTHRVFSSSADLVWPPAVAGKKHLPNAKPGSFRLIVVSQF